MATPPEQIDPKADDSALLLFDEACDFPCALEPLRALKSYVVTAHEFWPHVAAQREVRLRARLASATDPVRIGELEAEIELVRQESSETLPRLVWGGLLVSVYAAFESGVDDALRHWAKKVRHGPFVQKKGRSFLASAETYSQQNIGVALFACARSRSHLADLNTLRNSFVHKRGNFERLPEHLRTRILARHSPDVDCRVIDGIWVPSPSCVAAHLNNAERVLRTFGDSVFSKLADSLGLS